ncbi:hypothetical protein [Yoonia sediminilitoris]|uniref:hypothetical protein n=1 Tax=Yoonia sediminilitoris TaxID=1286148 RepID=UPI001056FFD7|nr:hypothetical protein [Yoonia sediminilitoris]
MRDSPTEADINLELKHLIGVENPEACTAGRFQLDPCDIVRRNGTISENAHFIMRRGSPVESGIVMMRLMCAFQIAHVPAENSPNGDFARF